MSPCGAYYAELASAPASNWAFEQRRYLCFPATSQLRLMDFHLATHGPPVGPCIYSLNLGLTQSSSFTIGMN